jgi:ADP-ribosylglycohydrolase
MKSKTLIRHRRNEENQKMGLLKKIVDKLVPIYVKYHSKMKLSDLGEKEPNDLEKIRDLRPNGPRIIWKTFDEQEYKKKVSGALHARMAGCILGAIVENWPVKMMSKWAKKNGDQFPPTDYWTKARLPKVKQYGMCPRSAFTRVGMNGVPVDDDIIYTLLGLLIVEKYGADFTIEDVGKAWLEYLPTACTAEEIALNNLKDGIPADKAAEINNPFDQLIGADIRSDPFAYMAPGLPEKAASMAYHDAYISHRKNGIYGEMFFSAAQAAAFTVDNAVDALKIGLTEIPEECHLANEVRWALEVGKDVKDYKQARELVDERYKGMNPVHTINNAVLTIWGLMIGGNDVTKVLSELIAMGLDNDCTAATAGSIVGAIVGIDGVPDHWIKNFNNKIYSYLNGIKKFHIDDVLDRFAKQAKLIFSNNNK